MLVTGAVQSNLVRIAAAAARRLGMEAHIQLEDRVDGMGALYRTSGNLLLDRVLGATLRSFPEGEDEAAADAAMECKCPRRRHSGSVRWERAPGSPLIRAGAWAHAAHRRYSHRPR